MWWRNVDKNIFFNIADKLLKKGFCDDEIINILSSAYWAVAGEYGD